LFCEISPERLGAHPIVTICLQGPLNDRLSLIQFLIGALAGRSLKVIERSHKFALRTPSLIICPLFSSGTRVVLAPDDRLVKRFWSKVSKEPGFGPNGDCWKWNCGQKRGYGQIRIGSRTDGTRGYILAHRLSYVIENGCIPDGLLICHDCDTPLCVRPSHLFAGIPLDNMRDMIRKDRQNFSGLSDHRKLSDSQIRDVFLLVALGRNKHSIAVTLGVSDTHINRILQGKVAFANRILDPSKGKNFSSLNDD